jgi:hypothetical protein
LNRIQNHSLILKTDIMTLSEAFQTMGGVFLLVQLILVLLILILTVQKFIVYYGRSGPSPLPFHRSHHAILFLGIFGLAWGFFMQMTGLIMALNAIIEAADVSPALLWMGLRNSFMNPLIGFCTALAAAIFWAILHGRYTSVHPGKS